MSREAAALKARIAELEAENDSLREQIGPATRTWTVAEISAMDREAYLEHEREVLAALREGRVRADGREARPEGQQARGRAFRPRRCAGPG